jgi:hypothetical protein
VVARAHPQGALSLVAVSRTARSGQWRCPERAVGDAHRLERSFRDISYVPKAPFATMPARAAGFGRRAYLTGDTNCKIIAGPWARALRVGCGFVLRF